MTTVLAFKGVTKYFLRGTPNAVKALDGVDLDVAPGDFIAIIGSNGAGKSTLIKAVSGLAVPDEGTVTFEGRDITRTPIYRRAAAIGRPRDLANAVGIGRGGFRGIELQLVVHHVALGPRQGDQLGRLLLEGHPRQQVADAQVDRRARVPVERRGLTRGGARGGRQHRQQRHARPEPKEAPPLNRRRFAARLFRGHAPLLPSFVRPALLATPWL